jgi:hypothetical protein
MKLRETTKKFIAMLEQKSGCMVHVQEVPDLPSISTIVLARGNLPGHVISFKPGQKNESPDYSIIFQCALALRMFECPPDDRKLIAGSPDGKLAVQDILLKSNRLTERLGLSAEQQGELRDHLLKGLVTHLRSIPLSLRVSQKLTVDYPELLELESIQVEKELRLGTESRADRVRENTPREIYEITQAINAAYAFFWAERLERPEIANPYRLDGFEAQGNELLRIFAEIPEEPVNDCELIDRWADYLNIRHWYKWIPYHSP